MLGRRIGLKDFVMPFLIIFIVIPLIELSIFAAVSEEIGLWTALFMALLTAMIGGNIVRMQGLQTISSMRGSMDQGRIPTSEIFDGFCVIFAAHFPEIHISV